MKYNKNFLKEDISDEDEKIFREKYKRKIFLKKEPKSVYDIVINMLSIDNGTYYTRGGTHCENGRYRSIVDIYKVCLTYFPTLKFKELLENYFSALYKNPLKYYCLNYNYCPTIKKYRFGFGANIIKTYKQLHGIKN